MIVRLQNGPLARLLHFALYERMVEFTRRVNPEIPGEAVVEGWLERMYQNDPDLHILVNLDENYRILEHAVISVQGIGGKRFVLCHQVFRDKPNLDTFKQGLAYIDELVRQVGALGSAIYVSKHIRVLERAGYHTAQVLMIKCRSDEEDAQETAEGLEPALSANGAQALP